MSQKVRARFVVTIDERGLTFVKGLPARGALLTSGQLRELARTLNEIANDADQGAKGEQTYPQEAA
ncbi:hypothetical protein [Pseudomonas asplenii]|uniref:hypothetical protein n=1 Tax=Pseudomonas asplenii TaxID=53407 RepID=UPI0006B424C5|nr:hypothetical protein [Pseudomonas fuscovaginae]KPA96004.1 hypothetical protein PF70_03982 [Pseudomonas fuscovaginae]